MKMRVPIARLIVEAQVKEVNGVLDGPPIAGGVLVQAVDVGRRQEMRH